MTKVLRYSVLALALALPGAVFAQHEAGAATAQSEQSASPNPSSPNATTDQHLATESKQAVDGKHESPVGEEEHNANLKYSASVKWLANKTGMDPHVAYWVFIGINFAILAGAIIWFSRSSIPAALRGRTASIQKGIEEARKASAEATARLSDIEARMAKLDTEIAELRATAEADFSAEEARIKQAADEDARRVVETAEQDIAAASRTAQRELKAFAAELAVGLAEKKIKVDAATDQELVRGFVAQLGKDGK